MTQAQTSTRCPRCGGSLAADTTPEGLPVIYCMGCGRDHYPGRPDISQDDPGRPDISQDDPRLHKGRHLDGHHAPIDRRMPVAKTVEERAAAFARRRAPLIAMIDQGLPSKAIAQALGVSVTAVNAAKTVLAEYREAGLLP